jgi:putative lipase involved disintegration of autophagic bodies
MRYVASTLFTLLSLALSSGAATQLPLESGSQLVFEPRQAHYSESVDDVRPITLFHDLEPQQGLVQLPSFRTLRAMIHRPRSKEAFQRARLRSIREGQTEHLDWDENEVVVPDLTDRGTVLELAKLAGNAYQLHGRKNWYDVDEKWNAVRRPLCALLAPN